MKDSEFKAEFPWPDQVGVTSLYKFFRVDENHPEYVEDLFVHGRLYHALPSQFNDPFEGKPHWRWPSDPKEMANIRKHFIKVSKQKGVRKKSAEKAVSNFMKNPDKVYETINNAAENTYSSNRICCFTTDKENLLFWAHYANSHKGFCVEFDATVLPISYAYKVKYAEEYPELQYPLPKGNQAFIPALTKSKHWQYEQEFRTVFIPDAESQPRNDGKSLILRGSEIKSVYLGARISEAHQELLLSCVTNGIFNPCLYSASLSRSSFSLEFKRNSENHA